MKPSSLTAAIALLCLGVAQAQTIERVRLTDNDLNCTQIYAEVQQMDTMIALAGSSAPAPAAPVAAAPPAADAQANALATGLAGLLGGNPAAGNAVNLGAAVPSGLMPGQAGIPVAALSDPRVQASVARARAAGYSDAQINAAMQLGAARAGYPVGAALAAQQAAPVAAPAPQQAVAAGLGGLFGALAGGGGGANAAQAASLFGSLAQASATPAPAAAPVPAPVARPAAPQGSNVAAQARARKDHLTSMFLSRGCKLSDVKK